MRHPDVALAIIAGGKGERLGGVTKALLRVEGESILARHLKLGEAFGEVLLVANDPAPFREVPVRRVSDELPDRGSPGGVHAALVHASRARVVAIAADMPFVTLRVLAQLLQAAEGARLACFEVAGRLEPLLGVYDTGLRDEWTRLLSGQPSFHELFLALQGRILPERILREVDPDLGALVNVNDREDLARWKIDWPFGWKSAQVAADDGADAD